MIYTGNHLSSSKGYLAMGQNALKLGADTFAFFTRNPRGGSAKEIRQSDADDLMRLAGEHHFGPLVAHSPYTMNLCSAKEDIREFSLNMLKEDLVRMEATPGQYLNFHPGSHTGQGAEKGIEQICSALNEALFGSMTTTVLLETMAGKGSEIGRTFEELRAIIDGTVLGSRLGVCLDTCHIWDGGYDLQHFDRVLDEFDRIIGLDRLKAIHFNGSLNPCGAAKDRHARLGEGLIDLQVLKAVAQNPRVQGLPFILETPNDDEGYAREIALMRSWF
ncbi:MAG: deoxyribonuclease IV [Firmicutes bacterium]|nr:deoxyribonuclease IV [Bacillota bacterium]